MKQTDPSPSGAPADPNARRTRLRDWLVACVLFGLVYWIFVKSETCQIGDSRYSLLITEHLLEHGDVNLKSEFTRPLDPARYPALGPTGYPANMHDLGEKVFYGAPIGGSVISAPFVMLFNAFGISARGADGLYDAKGEELMQMRLAALLMAGLTVLVFFTSRTLLPLAYSLPLTLGIALGSQIWSTASRALWSHTWMIFLLGWVVLHLVRAEILGVRLRPILLATLLSWTYFVRPSASCSILGVTLYVLIRHRRAFLWLAATGATWFALFAAYSRNDYGTTLPPYYRLGSTMSLRDFDPRILYGLLTSPSRGLLSCVPLVLVAVYLVSRYRNRLPAGPLVWVAAGVTVLHLAMISLLPMWVLHAGSSFGARYLTDVLPWIALGLLAGVAGWRARLAEGGAPLGPRLEFLAGAALLILGVVINWRGSTAASPWMWNAGIPGNESPELQYRYVMDWRYPQWLAGWIPPPAPDTLPILKPESPLKLGSQEAAPFLRKNFGWSGPEGEFNRTDGKRAHVLFSVEQPGRPARLELRLEPFLVPQKIPRQRCTAVLNGTVILDLDLTTPGIVKYAIDLPPGLLQERNLLEFKLPDAASLAALGLSPDTRRMGIKVYHITLDPPRA